MWYIDLSVCNFRHSNYFLNITDYLNCVLIWKNLLQDFLLAHPVTQVLIL